MTILTVILAILALAVWSSSMCRTLHGWQRRRCACVEFWVGRVRPSHTRKSARRISSCVFCRSAAPASWKARTPSQDQPGTLAGAPIGWRALILAAGALMNFLLGFLIVLILVLPQTEGTEPVIQGFADGFPSQGESMLMKGDRILSIDGYRVLLTSDVTTGLSLGTDTSYDIVVQRNGEKKELHDVKLEPAEYDGVQRYGVDFTVKQLTVVDKVKNAVYRSYDYARLVWISLKQLVSGQVGIDQMSGPVGVTDVLVQTAQSSMTSFFLLIAFISINLGVMNLLPLPHWTAGRLLFVHLN